ncbi:hypothetical protein FH972_022972 [Carpinus fangiana]|uniref:SHSP domain-containing protein n=1 Tax=Carpinus fangiana TaxID=176857 RepID=A0A5N6KUF9_9ROSI|nr:hypothetical protein FH972_022972 [Carpinus fangiana]
MTFFWNQPQFANSEFGPLFRFLDDYAEHSSTRAETKPTASSPYSSPTHFRPKFDIAETETAYELFGDLPGVAQQDLSVEFPDAQTLTVSGKVVRRTPKSDGTKASATDDDTASVKERQASVEDDDEFMQVEKASEQEQTTEQPQPKPETPKFKFHALERKLGQFSRTFTFPSPVDTDSVTASLRDGVLSLVVPKSTKAGVKKIVIQ